MNESARRFHSICKAVYTDYFKDLAKVEISNESTLEIFKIKVIPNYGIHSDIEYIITIKFQESNTWPLVYVDSIIFDKIKTLQYLQNRGKQGDHKGICIKNMAYGYCFNKNFKNICDNKWENYIYYLITVFNSIEDFEKGNGFKSNYKEILEI